MSEKLKENMSKEISEYIREQENEAGKIPCIYNGEDEYDEARYIVEQIEIVVE